MSARAGHLRLASGSGAPGPGVPAGPPPEAQAAVAAAAARVAVMHGLGRELHFTAGPGRRVSVELRTPDGQVLKSLTPSEALDLISGPLEP